MSLIISPNVKRVYNNHLTNILNSFNLNIRADFHRDYDSIINICKYSKVSDYFRFMKYASGGQHYPYYDSDFVIDKNTITKYSLVMYINDCEDGELVFCNDNRPPKTEMSFIERDTSDWDRQVEEEEILSIQMIIILFIKNIIIKRLLWVFKAH